MFNKLLALYIVSLAVPPGAYAQIVPNNDYAQMIVTTTDMLQSSISETIHLQANSSGPPSSTWCSPLPPPDLMRGMDGHVPPELQSDPRYQTWLRCQNRQSTHAPPAVVAQHLPMAATDFIPAVPGHPFVEQFLMSQPYTDEQRAALRLIGNEVSDADSDRYLIAVNDRLGTSRDVAAMSPIEKQNASDALIFQITVANLLANAGPDYPQAKEVSVQIAQALLLQLTGSPTGRLVY
jgi:hypothetical protein